MKAQDEEDQAKRLTTKRNLYFLGIGVSVGIVLLLGLVVGMIGYRNWKTSSRKTQVGIPAPEILATEKKKEEVKLPEAKKFDNANFLTTADWLFDLSKPIHEAQGNNNSLRSEEELNRLNVNLRLCDGQKVSWRMVVASIKPRNIKVFCPEPKGELDSGLLVNTNYSDPEIPGLTLDPNLIPIQTQTEYDISRSLKYLDTINLSATIQTIRCELYKTNGHVKFRILLSNISFSP